MKVYVITEDFETESGRTLESGPKAVVLSPEGVAAPYHARAFFAAATESQIRAIDAFNQVAALSAAGRAELGISARDFSKLEKNVNRAAVKAGDVVYVDMESSRPAPGVAAVYTEKPYDPCYKKSLREFRVTSTLAAHFSPAAQEVAAAVSTNSLRFLKNWKSRWLGLGA